MTTPQKSGEDYDNQPIAITLEDLLKVVDESDLMLKHHATFWKKEGGAVRPAPSARKAIPFPARQEKHEHSGSRQNGQSRLSFQLPIRGIIMDDKEILKKLKNKKIIIDSGKTVRLSKISSFSVGDEKKAPTDEEILKQGINHKCMFLGLNPSDTVDADWANFHRKSNGRPRSFDYRIYHLLGECPALKAKGIYMTDLGKGGIEGNGGSFVKKFKSAENEDYRKRCFAYLDDELKLLNGPDTVIICMHRDLPGLLRKYGREYGKEYNHVLYVPHYAFCRRGYGNDEAFYGFARESWKIAEQEVAKIMG